jgi:16S rRNA (guanine527-N7)-methyltransferase
MLDQTHHLAATGAQFLAMKGLYPEQEIQALSEDFILVKAHQLIIKGLAAERHLICIKRKE